ncbi:zinc finger protein 827-like [Polypterus senegalus]
MQGSRSHKKSDMVVIIDDDETEGQSSCKGISANELGGQLGISANESGGQFFLITSLIESLGSRLLNSQRELAARIENKLEGNQKELSQKMNTFEERILSTINTLVEKVLLKQDMQELEQRQTVSTLSATVISDRLDAVANSMNSLEQRLKVVEGVLLIKQGGQTMSSDDQPERPTADLLSATPVHCKGQGTARMTERTLEPLLQDIKRENTPPLAIQAPSVPGSPTEFEKDRRREYLQVPTFNGETDWLAFLEEFEVMAAQAKLDYSEKGLQLALHLKDEAVQVLTQLPSDKSQDFNELVRVLTLKYGRHYDEHYDHIKKQNESFGNLGRDLTLLLQRAYSSVPHNVSNPLILDNFLSGIVKPHDKEISPKTSLGSFIKKAAQHEEMLQSTCQGPLISRFRAEEEAFVEYNVSDSISESSYEDNEDRSEKSLLEIKKLNSFQDGHESTNEYSTEHLGFNKATTGLLKPNTQAFSSSPGSNMRLLQPDSSRPKESALALSRGGTLALLSSSHHAQELNITARTSGATGMVSATASPNNSRDMTRLSFKTGSLEKCNTGPVHDDFPQRNAVERMKTAASVALYDRNTVMTLSSSSSSSAEPVTEENSNRTFNFDGFDAPFSSLSASSILATLSKKVTERSLSPSSLLTEETSLVRSPQNLAQSSEIKHEPTTFSETPSLQLSLASVVDKSMSQVCSIEENGKMYHCSECGLIIKTKSSFKRHMGRHTGLKGHFCSLCPFRCSRKDNLKKHMKLHEHQNREETFQCEMCSFTARKFSLKRHMQCHQHSSQSECDLMEDSMTDTPEEAFHLENHVVRLQSQGSMDLHGGVSEGTTDHLPIKVVVKEEPEEMDISVSPSPKYCTAQEPVASNRLTGLLLNIVAANKNKIAANDESQNFSFQKTQSSNQDLQCMVVGANTSSTADHLCSNGSSLPQGDGEAKAVFQLPKEGPQDDKKVSAERNVLKTEPMEESSHEDPPICAHTVDFSTLVEHEGRNQLHETNVHARNPLFTEDISVKVASELLFRLSEKAKLTAFSEPECQR